jgi:hypothetical protein
MRAAHLCHATDCQVPVPRAVLMCRRHWSMVPLPLRIEVWVAYRAPHPGPRPSARYCRAARAAIAAVAEMADA